MIKLNASKNLQQIIENDEIQIKVKPQFVATHPLFKLLSMKSRIESPNSSSFLFNIEFLTHKITAHH